VPFTKLDKNFCESSILAHGPEVAGIWAYLLAAAGSSGSVTATVPAMAGVFRTTEDRIMAILTVLEQPDPWSRTPDNDGRRIRIERDPEWQIVLLNHSKYRSKDHTAADRQRRHRRKPVTRDVTVSRVTGRDRRDVTQAEAEADTDRRKTDSQQPTFYRPPGPANPLISGRRVELERECLNLVTEVASVTGEDPVEVIAHASGYKGAATTKLNPATMSDDRLANTVRDLRADCAALKRKREVQSGPTR
jgi:hypothetical protein